MFVCLQFVCLLVGWLVGLVCAVFLLDCLVGSLIAWSVCRGSARFGLVWVLLACLLFGRLVFDSLGGFLCCKFFVGLFDPCGTPCVCVCEYCVYLRTWSCVAKVCCLALRDCFAGGVFFRGPPRWQLSSWFPLKTKGVPSKTDRWSRVTPVS